MGRIDLTPMDGLLVPSCQAKEVPRYNVTGGVRCEIIRCSCV